MTRFGYVHAEKISLHGVPAITLDGTPADCVHIGIHHFCKGKPDLVVSGINAGLNAGMSFVFSSGTVGACIEANIAGIPALALSQAFDSETMNRYAAEYALLPEVTERLAIQTRQLLDRVFSFLRAERELLTNPITWSINLPFVSHADTKLRVCPLGHTRYGNCFKREDLRFEHVVREVYIDPRPECDSNLLAQGHVTITPLDMREFGQVERFGAVKKLAEGF